MESLSRVWSTNWGPTNFTRVEERNVVDEDDNTFIKQITPNTQKIIINEVWYLNLKTFNKRLILS